MLTPVLHRDPAVWGADAEEFDPDHFAPERIDAVPPNAYKPFGTGLRACIGRQFALQEATLVLGMLLQRFEFIDHRDYQLHTKTTLTIKPDDFWIQVRPRTDRAASTPSGAAGRGAPPTARRPRAEPRRPVGDRHGTPLLVLFGSNLGTAEGIATRLAREGTERGFDVTVGALDDHVDDLPPAAPCWSSAPPTTASRRRTPPAFCRLDRRRTGRGRAAGVSYTVFGCGDTEWAATYQAVPTLLDAAARRHGARRIHPRGEGDARADFDGEYRAWHDDAVDRPGARALGLPAEAAATARRRPAAVDLDGQPAADQPGDHVLRARARAGPRPTASSRTADGSRRSGPPGTSRSRCPPGCTTGPGDHLGVLPRNSLELIRRVMARFGLDAGQYLTIVPERRRAHPPADRRAGAAAGRARQLRRAAGRRHPRRHRDAWRRYTDDPAQRAELLQR